MSQRPTCDEKRNFLLLAYFGADGDQTDCFISRAYRDMNRTLHGLSKRENAKELVQNAMKDLRNSLCKLQRLSVSTIPDERIAAFDQWHRCACARLIGSFLPFHCYYGQAQKWINMTIKYCWFVRNESELQAWYPVAHVPVDEFILRAAKEAGIKRPCEKWSRWDNPKEYEEFQKLIRNEADELGKTSLALEHDWWMEKAATMSQQIAMTQEELEGLIVKDVRRHAHCTGFKDIRVHRIADDQIPGTNWSYGNSGMDYGGADEKVCNDALREVVYRMQRQYRLS